MAPRSALLKTFLIQVEAPEQPMQNGCATPFRLTLKTQVNRCALLALADNSCLLLRGRQAMMPFTEKEHLPERAFHLQLCHLWSECKLKSNNDVESPVH